MRSRRGEVPVMASILLLLPPDSLSPRRKINPLRAKLPQSRIDLVTRVQLADLH